MYSAVPKVSIYFFTYLSTYLKAGSSCAGFGRLVDGSGVGKTKQGITLIALTGIIGSIGLAWYGGGGNRIKKWEMGGRGQ